MRVLAEKAQCRLTVDYTERKLNFVTATQNIWRGNTIFDFKISLGIFLQRGAKYVFFHPYLLFI